jgi:hypothetical protein
MGQQELHSKVTPREANENFLAFAREHCMAVQSGKFGECTLEDLNFVGKIHTLIEEGLDTR